jgi:hypothetical protein
MIKIEIKVPKENYQASTLNVGDCVYGVERGCYLVIYPFSIGGEKRFLDIPQLFVCTPDFRVKGRLVKATLTIEE